MGSFLSLLIRAGLGRGWFRKFILYAWAGLLGPRVEVTRGGIRYRLNIRDNTTDGKIFAYPGGPDRAERAILAEHCRHGVFVDLGANTGFYSLSMAVAGARRVIAVEPNPRALERLRTHVAINAVEDRVTIVPVGVGPPGRLRIRTTQGDLGSAQLSQFGEGSSVPVLSLAAILGSVEIRKVDALKADIEGMEDGALLPFFKEVPLALWPSCVVIEHTHRALWRQDVLAFLTRRDYRASEVTRENTVLVSGSVADSKQLT